MTFLRGLDKFLLIGGALIVVTSNVVRHLSTEGEVLNVASLKAVFPRAERFVHQREPLPHYQALATHWKTGAEELIGYCFDTAQIAPQVRGYGGPIHVLVGMDLSGHLLGVNITEHYETPFFVEGFQEPWFTQQFVGKGLNDPLAMGQDLDGLSGATVSSTTVARGIRESLVAVAGALPGISPTETRSDFAPRSWWWQALTVLGLMAFCLVAFWRRFGKLRMASLILGLAVVGFALNGSLSVVHLVNVLSLRWPLFPAHASWYLLFLFGMVTALCVGRLYCGWLCPFGALQEFLKKLVPYRLSLPSQVHRRARQLRIILLWFIVCLVLITGNRGLLRYEPFSMAFSLKGNGLMWTSLILILGASLFMQRFWCRYFCVVGAAFHLLGKLGWRRKRNAVPRSGDMTGDF